MSDFQTVRGFEDVWRPPVRVRHVHTSTILQAATSSRSVRARLRRIVAKAPEVMVKVTGRTGDPGHLRAHLDYISRNGRQELETEDGALVVGRTEVRDLAEAWAAEQLADPQTRSNAPFTHSLVLSMPEGTDPMALRDAARAFAADVFAGRHDYAFTLHTDTSRSHVHLSICSRGHTGERLNPRKADLEHWRQVFAQALRDRGVEAEATPRRSRGVTRKAEKGPIRRMRERHQGGRGKPSEAQRGAYTAAAKAAFQGAGEPTAWEAKTRARQARIRALYVAQAEVLKRAADPADHALGAKVEAFIRAMPQPDSQRLALARELRAARPVVDRPNDRER